MGKYINRDARGIPLPAKGKAGALIADGATHLLEKPKFWVEDLVCVVDAGAFDAAAYVYDEKEFIHFTANHDARALVWLIYKSAKDLAA